jgi:FkbM family methyltransferase
MLKLTLDRYHLALWRDHKGDYTHILNHDLDVNSNVVELGGFTGVWTTQIHDKFQCNVYAIEPIKKFYDQMVDKFKDQSNIHLLNVGVGTEDKKGIIYLSDDGSSSNAENNIPVEVEFRTLNRILNEWDIKEVDLLQMNIEGDEYPILENLLETETINRIKTLQVQFHLGIEDDRERKEAICEKLKAKGFKLKYSYPFVWEAWIKE